MEDNYKPKEEIVKDNIIFEKSVVEIKEKEDKKYNNKDIII